jgi:hypothetical protein
LRFGVMPALREGITQQILDLRIDGAQLRLGSVDGKREQQQPDEEGKEAIPVVTGFSSWVSLASPVVRSIVISGDRSYRHEITKISPGETAIPWPAASCHPHQPYWCATSA